MEYVPTKYEVDVTLNDLNATLLSYFICNIYFVRGAEESSVL